MSFSSINKSLLYLILINRGLTDSVLLANEVIEDLRRKGRSGLCLKVDFEKAYDSVRWEYMYDMLDRMGFHNTWIKWTRGCMELATVSVPVNGSPTEEFIPTRGLRQSLSTVSVYNSWSNVVSMKAIQRGFEIASGLKINFHKSSLVGINVENTNLRCYSKLLNCGQMGYPFKYLGLEVGGNPRKKTFWKPVLEKLKARLSVWKGRFLSLAGRTCVIKSMLTAIPLFYLSVYKSPESVYKSIISTQRKFLWGWGKEKRPISWRLISQEKGKWKEVLLSKYGLQLDDTQIPVKYQSWWWRDIKKICREGEGEGWFKEELRWKLGRGDKIRFWEDVWVGNTSLKTCFQRLYTLTANQEQKVEEAGGWECSEWQWRLQWRRERFEWESEMERSLLERVSGSAVKRYVNETQVWGEEELERYTASGKQNLVWKGIWAAVIRGIWDQRNSILFNQGVVDVEEMIQMAKLKSWMNYGVEGYLGPALEWQGAAVLRVKKS
ncbi:uncharacterized protein [Phaseolus vulgaris]|uniref:uncharacterized protein n=1 Tax=Phaseolus vulgaris TaxID=3885 RepID=UPI0035C9B05C